MLCNKPFMKGGLVPLPCGQCMPCRINKRRVWTTRINLETFQHEKSCFLTLTYDPEHLPDGGFLVKRDLQLFLKRLRSLIYPVPIRYFGVGEYGDQTWRPHYHIAIWGLNRDDHEVVTKAWGLGFIHFGEMTRESSQYIAGYVTKKLTAANDVRLAGRPPEFSVMSRNPGIGSKAALQIADQMTRSSGGALWIAKNGDVPKVARLDGGMWPLGRYMVSKIRENTGFADGNSPPAKKEEYLAKMRDMRADYGNLAFQASKPFLKRNKSDQMVNSFNVRNSRRSL